MTKFELETLIKELSELKEQVEAVDNDNFHYCYETYGPDYLQKWEESKAGTEKYIDSKCKELFATYLKELH